jgi:hypothetical protein
MGHPSAGRGDRAAHIAHSRGSRGLRGIMTIAARPAARPPGSTSPEPGAGRRSGGKPSRTPGGGKSRDTRATQDLALSTPVTSVVFRPSHE